jgi:hypothetical protein
MKMILSAAVGLLVGLAVGYFLWAEHGTKTTPPPTRGEWPNVPCPPSGDPPGTVLTVCDEISNLAMAVQPLNPDSQYCAVKAQSVKSATPADEIMASQHVHNARMAARSGDWVGCRRELDGVD